MLYYIPCNNIYYVIVLSNGLRLDVITEVTKQWYYCITRSGRSKGQTGQ